MNGGGGNDIPIGKGGGPDGKGGLIPVLSGAGGGRSGGSGGCEPSSSELKLLRKELDPKTVLPYLEPHL